MKQDAMLHAIRIELQDSDSSLYENDEILRAVDKAVSLLSRLVPKRGIAETTLVRSITNETLTIATSTGTLAYKPVKKDTLSITGKVLDTDFRINYLTGVVTEIGANLPDTTYTATYELDPTLLDLSTFLNDYIKIERVEYPAGETPVTNLTFDSYGSILSFRGTVSLDDTKHIRVVYLSKWTAPTVSVAGDYPSNLDDAVIIGSVGEALIYKAEYYTQKSVEALADITAPTKPTLAALTPPTSPTFATLVAPTSPTLVTPSAPVAPTLATLTAPTDYTFSKPSSPSLPSDPTAPTAPTIAFTDVETSVTAIGTEIAAAKAHHTTGAGLVNTATRGSNVASVYGQYADTVMSGAGHRVNEAMARLREIEDTINLYQAKVTAYGSDVNAYANKISGTMNKYSSDIAAESAGSSDFATRVSKYTAQINANNTLINLYAQAVSSFQVASEEDNVKVTKYSQEVNSYQAQVSNQNLLASKFASEVNNYMAQIEKQRLDIQNYTQEVAAYASQVNTQDLRAKNYLDIAGRYLASGQAKINEMLAMLGLKAEFNFSKASSEQRS